MRKRLDFQAANGQALSLTPELPSAVRYVLGEQHVPVRGRYPQRDAGSEGGAWSMNCARATANLNEPFKAILAALGPTDPRMGQPSGVRPRRGPGAGMAALASDKACSFSPKMGQQWWLSL
jgi:hypothetical protein